jgi:ribose/xylose/arabinose/galactoside ABC-type transport system permease subunit
MAGAVIVAAPMAAVAAVTAVAADGRPRVTAVARVTAVVDVLLRATAAGIPLPVTVAAAVAIRRRAADHRTVVGRQPTAVDRRRVAAAEDMDGDTALDSFPA